MSPSEPTPPARTATGGRSSLWLKGVFPLLLLGGLLGLFLTFGPAGVFRASFPPIEELTLERIDFPAPGRVRVRSHLPDCRGEYEYLQFRRETLALHQRLNAWR